MAFSRHVRLPLLLAAAILVGLLSGLGTASSQGSFTATGDLNTGRSLHQAVALPDGRVLITGGNAGAGPIAST